MGSVSVQNGYLRPTSAPEPTGPVVTGYGPDAITSGAQLTRTSFDSWPQKRDAGAKAFTAYRPNGFHEQVEVAIPANYGAMGDAAPYRDWEGEYTPSTTVDPNEAAIGNYPGPVPFAGRPTYNNMPSGAPYNVEVITPTNMNPRSYQDLLKDSVQFSPAQTASVAQAGASPLTAGTEPLL